MTKKRLPLLSLLAMKNPGTGKDDSLARILCGEVFVDGECVRDPRRIVRENSEIRYAEKEFVSRGAFKLIHALDTWSVQVGGKVFIDAGASTGGFTDALLKRGASAVHAVDVGYNQIDFSLRRDERVIVHERVNIMEMQAFNPVPDAAVADLSFRSVVKAAAHILQLTREGWMIALVKPQFELRDPDESFRGVIEDRSMLERVLLEVLDRFERESIVVDRTLPSPVKGRKGNVEFVFLIRRTHERGDTGSPETVRRILIEQVNGSEPG